MKMRSLLSGTVTLVAILWGCSGVGTTNTGPSAFSRLPPSPMPELLALGLPDQGSRFGNSPWVEFAADGSHSAPLLDDESYTDSGDLKVVGEKIYHLISTSQVLIRDGLAPGLDHTVLGEVREFGGKGPSALAVGADNQVYVLVSGNRKDPFSALYVQDVGADNEVIYAPVRRINPNAFGLEAGPDGVFYSLDRPYDGTETQALLRFTRSEALTAVPLSTPIPVYEPNAARYLPFQEARAQLRLEGEWLVLIQHERSRFSEERWQNIAMIHTQTGEVRRVD